MVAQHGFEKFLLLVMVAAVSLTLAAVWLLVAAVWLLVAAVFLLIAAGGNGLLGGGNDLLGGGNDLLGGSNNLLGGGSKRLGGGGVQLWSFCWGVFCVSRSRKQGAQPADAKLNSLEVVTLRCQMMENNFGGRPCNGGSRKGG